MFHFNGTILRERTVWELITLHDSYQDDALCIKFHLPIKFDRDKEALNYLKQHLMDEERQWLKFESKRWIIDLDIFQTKFGKFIDDSRNKPEPEEGLIFLDFGEQSEIYSDLLTGKVDVQPEISHRNRGDVSKTTINFIISYQDMTEVNRPKRIFLSHKSSDKPLVREYRDILKALGFEPWMDEDDIKAGDKIHRSLYQGIKESCAAIFFVTENYKDERYLQNEIDYAITEATDRGERFRIITLVFVEKLEIDLIPKLLQQYVFKQVSSQFEGLKVILKGLPLRLSAPDFM